MILIIDNYDSFTHNLARYFVELGQIVKVVRNDAISISQIEHLAPSHIVISPGPCRPENAGISVDVIKHFCTTTPILGVCLGHQALGLAFGALVVNAAVIKHGKTSLVDHCGKGLFDQIEQPFTATRYHSLVLDEKTINKPLKISAWSTDIDIREVMAIEHESLPLYGVQFHPESLLTSEGHHLLANFIECK